MSDRHVLHVNVKPDNTLLDHGDGTNSFKDIRLDMHIARLSMKSPRSMSLVHTSSEAPKRCSILSGAHQLMSGPLELR